MLLDYVNEMQTFGIPEHMIRPLNNYLVNRWEPGSFLISVLSNDFCDAVLRADSVNIKSLDAYAQFLMNIAPDESWGSQEKVLKWLSDGKDK